MPEGRTIVITGAASGLGRAWTLGFLADGAKVFAADIDAAGLASLADAGAEAVPTDVADDAAVAALVERAVTGTGRIDALFNNAGTGFGARIEDAEPGQFERCVAIHLFGAVSGMRHAIPHMRRQGSGRIVNTLSRAAEFAPARNGAYAAGKAALWAATCSAARETRDADILMNMLIPGPTNTAIWGRARPDLQAPEVTYATARMLATLPADGPRGKVFWNQREYPMFDPSHLEAGA